MEGLRALPALLSMEGSFAWPPALDGMGSGHLPLLTGHLPGQSSVHRASPSLSIVFGGVSNLGEVRGRLLVKFSVRAGAAAQVHLPEAATGALLPGGGRGWLRLGLGPY